MSPEALCIDEVAAQWVARQADAPLGAEAQAAFDVWYAADTRHQGAYFRAQAAWAMLGRARVMGAGQVVPESVTEAAALAAPVGQTVSVTRRRWLGRVAGGAVAACAGMGFVTHQVTGGRVALQTGVGELRRLPLKDQTIASVNTDSHVEVALKPHLREVKLHKGEVWFDVAKDPERPFQVQADHLRVQAVGTAFGVRRFDNGIEVLVSEGTVRVRSERLSEVDMTLTAGHMVFVAFDQADARADFRPESVDRALAWREGQIALDNDRLDTAIAEFNRYNRQKIVLADEALAGEKLVGWFRTDQPEAFARAVHEALGAPVRVNAQQITIGETVSAAAG
ncbi:FecR family protein [Asticcacaulis tiandongensis]|uniref:FecR family protein n=1 Tax=Asticcacaulis tiandongensis TaxID=2565365 RepID=UPI00112BAF56|nr:FecR domain-containing protein [Asticcacaulis tiandongensis]